MGIYLTIEENIGDMLEGFCSNENIQKLLYNLERSALTDSLPLGFSGLNLLNNRIFDRPKLPDPVTDRGCFLMAYLDDCAFAGENNLTQYNMYVVVHVMCHVDSWRMDRGAKRPLRILEELNNSINNLGTSSIRGEWVVKKPAKFMAYNNVFTGYMVVYEVTNQTSNCSVD